MVLGNRYYGLWHGRSGVEYENINYVYGLFSWIADDDIRFHAAVSHYLGYCQQYELHRNIQDLWLVRILEI